MAPSLFVAASLWIDFKSIPPLSMSPTENVDLSCLIPYPIYQREGEGEGEGESEDEGKVENGDENKFKNLLKYRCKMK